MLNNSSILITGGTGSFGRAFTRFALENYSPRRLVIFSRDEFKQYEMQSEFPLDRYGCIRFFLGDVRDQERLTQAFRGIDVVVHAAAIKQVPAAEYNPFECVKTNIIGSENIINAAVKAGVPKVIALSTDKAVNPLNLYGATKLASEKIFIAGNFMAGATTSLSVVRYGNVVGSRGSVVPLFKSIIEKGGKTLPVTDTRMTRFWITLPQAIRFVIQSMEEMQGGEVFVPKIPSMNIVDLARALAPDCEIETIGIRPGEKLHEIMLSAGESPQAVELPDRYILLPSWVDADKKGAYREQKGATETPPDFEYSSETNDDWLDVDRLKQMMAE